MTEATGDRFVTVAVTDTNGLLRGQKSPRAVWPD
jgi:hypothetical protein